MLKLSKRFSLDELEEAMEHCIAENSCNTHELIAFLIFRYGESKVRAIIGSYMFYQCRDRAKEMEGSQCQPSEK